MHKCGNGGHVGRVIGLWRYPVKSMGGEALNDVDVSWHGFAGDRRWAFVRNGVVQSGFPWLTLRERGDMNHYVPSFVDPTHPDTSPTVVRTPEGATFDVTDPSLATQLWPAGTRVIKHDRGVFDTFPLSLITRQTIEALGDMVGSALDVQRFRPNLLIDVANGTPFAEDEWVGRVVRVGSLRMRIDKRDGRCAVITIDPATSRKEPRVLRAVAQERQGCIGVYGSTVEPGRVALDDDVRIIE